MAEHSSRSAGEHAGHPASVRCEQSVTDREHTAVNLAQPSLPDPVLQRTAPDSKQRIVSSFCMHVMQKADTVGTRPF